MAFNLAAYNHEVMEAFNLYSASLTKSESCGPLSSAKQGKQQVVVLEDKHQRTQQVAKPEIENIAYCNELIMQEAARLMII